MPPPSLTLQILTRHFSSWLTVNSLNHLPNLKDLRFKSCPLVDSITGVLLLFKAPFGSVNGALSVSAVRTQVIARVKTLQVFSLFAIAFFFVVCTTASLHQCALKIHRKNGMRLLSLSLYTHSSSSSSPLALVVVHLLLLTQLTRLGFSAFPLRIALM